VSQSEEKRSWWQTLPGMLTAAAGLISAITGLVVAVQQLWPHHAAPPAQAAGSTTLSDTSVSTSTAPIVTAPRLHVRFPAGTHVEIADAVYDVLSGSVRPANPGQLDLTLRVRMTNNSRYPGNFWNATFRLRLGDETSAPTGFLDDVVAGGTTDAADIDFRLPSTARRAVLLVGDDPSKAVALPISLVR
jgi:hypothetical protein